jgi:hypothetical protein
MLSAKSANLPTIRDGASHYAPPALMRELTLWTTRDGREIPLDEMTDDHVANALRVLSVWRSRIKKQDAGAPIVAELRDAIDRFKSIQRQRRKALPAEDRPVRPATGFGGRSLQKSNAGESGPETGSPEKGREAKSGWPKSRFGKRSLG